MKYCPQNRNHKNPNNAIFCSECGSKLIEEETDKKKICPNCHSINPNNALYCSECGNMLTDIDNKVELIVNTNIICDAILLCGTVKCIRNASKAIFKIEANSNVDVLFDCNGKCYRKHVAIGNSSSKIFNVEFGTINVFCEPGCQIKMSGSNMDCPLIKSGVSNTKIKAPYGIYELDLILNNEKEHLKIDLHTTEIKISSTLRKKYKLTIDSDVCLKGIQVTDKKLFVKTDKTSANSITCYLPQDKYNIDVYVEDISHTVGYCKRVVELKGDTNISIQWLNLSIDTNAKNTICSYSDIDCFKYVGEGLFNLYIARGDTYSLKYYLSDSFITEKISAHKATSLKLERKWRNVILSFENNNLMHGQNLDIEYKIDLKDFDWRDFKDHVILHSKADIIEGSIDDFIKFNSIRCQTQESDRTLFVTSSIYEKAHLHKIMINENETKHLIRNLSYGRHFVLFRPNDKKYKYNYRTFWVDDKTNEINLKVFSELTDKARWNWLRKFIFYAVWVLFLIPIIVIPFIDMIYLFLSGDMDNELSIFACIASCTFSCFIIYDYFIILIKKRFNIKMFLYMSLLTIILGFISTLGIKFDLDLGNDRWGICLIPLVVYSIVFYISYLIYNLKIKKWSINETLME